MVPGMIMLIVAALLVWLGIHSRKNAYKNYQEDVLRYTAAVTMKIVHLEEHTTEHWEDRDDGTRELVSETVYLPTYEYMADGKTYQYHSGQGFSDRNHMGQQVTGYYDPADPKQITENKPQKPILGGFFFFIGAVLLLILAIFSFSGEVYWMF